MRKFLLALFLGIVGIINASAASTQDYTLYSGTVTCGDNWASGYAQISANSAATTGDTLIVHVTAISTTDSNPVVYVQNKSWKDFPVVPKPSLTGVTAPTYVKIVLPDSAATELATKGLIVKGSGYTFDEVVLRHKLAGTEVTMPTVTFNNQTYSPGTYDGIAHVFDKVTVTVPTGYKLYVDMSYKSDLYSTASALTGATKSKLASGTDTTLTIGNGIGVYVYAVAVDANGNVSDLETVGLTGLTYPVTFGETGWMTLSEQYIDFDFSSVDGFTAYTAAFNSDKSAIELTKVEGKVARNTGLILKGTANTTYYIPTPYNTNKVSGNVLTPQNSWSDYKTADGVISNGLHRLYNRNNKII